MAASNGTRASLFGWEPSLLVGHRLDGLVDAFRQYTSAGAKDGGAADGAWCWFTLGTLVNDPVRGGRATLQPRLGPKWQMMSVRFS